MDGCDGEYATADFARHLSVPAFTTLLDRAVRFAPRPLTVASGVPPCSITISVAAAVVARVPARTQIPAMSRMRAGIDTASRLGRRS